MASFAGIKTGAERAVKETWRSLTDLHIPMKILLADDEPIARTMLEHWLTGWGYQVTCVRDGEAAINALSSDPELKLAIVDWVMPKRDGLDVCRHIRASSAEPYVYVVLLTAKD